MPFVSRGGFKLKKALETFDVQVENRVCLDAGASTGGFTDCLLQAAQLLEKQQIYNYDYILVDEFQDISIDKYKYLSALRCKEPRTRIFCVGDDWQSIYRFSGSDISLFSQFEKYNGPTEELKIEATHRFGEPLLQQSS